MKALRLTEAQYKTIAKKIAMVGPVKRGMNKTETAYSIELEMQRRAGMIDWYCFEGIKLRLADGAYYTPDFAVIVNGVLEFREVKGFMREAANVRIKVAAELYPFKFRVIKFDRGAWTVRDV